MTKLETCGVEQCPFRSYISEAIKEAQKIELLSFDLSKEEVLEGETIQVSWRTRNCKSVSISNYGAVGTSGTISLPITRRTRDIEINLVDLFDEAFHHKKRIRVRRKPTLTILDCKDKVLIGERSFVRFRATNAKSILLTDENSGRVSDISNLSLFESDPLSKDAKFTLSAIGKYGGEAKEEISIQVFEPPLISYFKCDNPETVDTLPIFFSFDYRNAHKAEIRRDGILIADVTGRKTFTCNAENKMPFITITTFELVITGKTGTTTRAELPDRVSISPQPSINKIQCSPDNIILFPDRITFTNYSTFCEKILLSDGKISNVIKPNESVTVNPSFDTRYVFTPMGKQGFHGQEQTVLIQVFHPVEIEAAADKRVTLPNLPVTISWQAKNHSQILIEPGKIDVTNSNSYEMRLEERTTVKVWGINKRHKRAAEVFIDVLSYPKFNHRIFGDLPKVNLQIPQTDKISQELAGIRLSKSLSGVGLQRRVSSPANLVPHLLSQLLSLFNTFMPKKEFSLSREMRKRLFTEIKGISRKE